MSLPRRYDERRRVISQRRRRFWLILCILGIGLCYGANTTSHLFTGSEPVVQPLMERAVEPQPSAGTATLSYRVLADTGVMISSPDPIGTVVPTTNTADPFFHPARFSYAPNLSTATQLQAWLDQQPGILRTVRIQVGDRSQSLAEVLAGSSMLYSINPQIILTLFEQQQQLISTVAPTQEQQDWAVGYHDPEENTRGLASQMRWATIELRRALRDYAMTSDRTQLPPYTFSDKTTLAPEPNVSLSMYAIGRVLAATTTPVRFPTVISTFRQQFITLFGDPGPAPSGWPGPSAPFLTTPSDRAGHVTSFFDHDTPFLRENGSLWSYWNENNPQLSYDGHTGWDYALQPPDQALAAADGVVAFAGNSDDGCGIARAVILDHGNGYRSLYWHLDRVAVETGQSVARGTVLGVIGSTGCATGPHLHFQVQYLGRDVDPFGWCGSSPDPWAANPAGQTSVWLWADQLSPCAPLPANAIMVDEQGTGFLASSTWGHVAVGIHGSAAYTATLAPTHDTPPWAIRDILPEPAVAVWQPSLPAAGRYRVLAYIPYALNGLDESEALFYRIFHADGMNEITVNAYSVANGWANLGVWQFDPAAHPQVSLSSYAGDSGRGLWTDAIVWLPLN